MDYEPCSVDYGVYVLYLLESRSVARTGQTFCSLSPPRPWHKYVLHARVRPCSRNELQVNILAFALQILRSTPFSLGFRTIIHRPEVNYKLLKGLSTLPVFPSLRLRIPNPGCERLALPAPNWYDFRESCQ